MRLTKKICSIRNKMVVLGIGLSINSIAWAAPITSNSWFQSGQSELQRLKSAPLAKAKAKNIILFVGDGMGVSTVTAARILEGQLRGNPGEENNLSFEMLPYSAFAKTYNTNQQVPDSAGTMTAMMSGVKTKAGVIGVDDSVIPADCQSSKNAHVKSLLEHAEEIGMRTGIISTARITHATPAATYAHSPHRNWESDEDIPEKEKALGCVDIATQLVDFPYGDGIEVVLGGGRREFLPSTEADPEYSNKMGDREDGVNLIEKWQAKHAGGVYVWNDQQFSTIDFSQTDKILGLFEPSHMQYEADRMSDEGSEPSIEKMTSSAIEVLKRGDKGYFLMVESGRIDHGHHAGNAYRALHDTVAFSNAVKKVMETVDLKETLIIVTADHSHVFTISGYPTRGNPILGKVVGNASDGTPASDFSRDMLGLPYTSLTYANGPGYSGMSDIQDEGHKEHPHQPGKVLGITDGRPNLEGVDTTAATFMQEAVVPLSSETHSAEDVGIYAGGPNAHLFRGVLEQHLVYHIMNDAIASTPAAH